MSRRGEINARKRRQHLPDIKAFLDDLGVEWHYVHGYEWHIRVNGLMDIFPTNNKYHFIKTDQRGEFEDYEELGQIFAEYVEHEEN